MKLDRRAILWAAAVIGVTAAFVFLVARPQSKKARELTGLIDAERAEQASAQQRAQSIARLDQEVEVLAARTKEFDARIPAEPALGPFLEELARLAEAQQLRPDQVDWGSPIRSDEVVALPIAFKVRGPFRAVYVLMQGLERLPRLVEIERFEARAEEEAPGTVAAEVKLRIFSRAL